MPYPLVYGDLPDYDLQEFRETGLLTETCTFNPDDEIIRKKGNTHGSYRVDKQVQVWPGTLGIELKGSIIPDADGKVVGLAAVTPGQSVTCVHFAAAAPGVPAIARHGYTRDPDMLLMVEAPRTELGAEIPSVTVPMRYFPFISKTPVVIAAQGA